MAEIVPPVRRTASACHCPISPAPTITTRGGVCGLEDGLFIVWSLSIPKDLPSFAQFVTLTVQLIQKKKEISFGALPAFDSTAKLTGTSTVVRGRIRAITMILGVNGIRLVRNRSGVARCI